MLTGVIIFLAVVLAIIILFAYKKEMLIKMFSLNISAPASEFTQQLEQTAEVIIRRLEDEATELEVLLEEAETKIGMLSQQVEHANDLIKQLMALQENRHTFKQSPPELPVYDKNSVLVMTNRQGEETLTPTGEPLRGPDTGGADNEKYNLVMSMAGQGCTVTEIAKATGMGQGEITLLLQLNKK